MGSRISSIKRYVYGPQNWQTSVPSATMAAARYTIARARLSTRTWRSLQISALEMQNGSHHYKRAGSGALRTRIRLIYSTRLACSLHYAQICTAQSVRALLLLQGSDDLVGHVHGAVDILDVVELLKTVDQALNLLGVGAGDLGRGGRDHGGLGALDLGRPAPRAPWRQP